MEFKRQERARPTSEQARQALAEQFEFIVELLESWVVFMKSILGDEALVRFLAEEEVVGGEVAVGENFVRGQSEGRRGEACFF